jgi:XisI protein
MDKLVTYRRFIVKILTEYAQPSSSGEDLETQFIFDTERDHYQLADIGWDKGRRVFGVLIHIDIKDGKIWLQYNGTETPIAERLVEMGVPAHDIVLGFHSEFKRQFSKYAMK